MLPVLAVLGGCGSSSQARAPPNIRSRGMQLRDLPKGTTADLTRFWTNAQAAKRDRVPLGVYTEHGRVRSYHNSFFHLPINGVLPAWMERADGEVTEFKDVRGAHWEFLRQRVVMRHAAVESSPASGTLSGASGVYRYPYHALRVPRVGDEDEAYTVDSPSDEVAYTTRVLLLRRGRFVALLRMAGYEGHFPVQDAVGVARAVDGRLRTAAQSR
jgi:hypothetical protein